MKNKLYTVEDLVEILNLHPKTIRRFIREGRLTGRKIGRAWMVDHESLKAFAHAELAPTDDAPSDAAAVPEGASGLGPDGIRVSAVVEIDERDPEEASRISNSLIAMLNCKDPSWGPVRYDMMQEPGSRRARFVLYGKPAFIAAMMGLFETIRGPEEEG